VSAQALPAECPTAFAAVQRQPGRRRRRGACAALTTGGPSSTSRCAAPCRVRRARGPKEWATAAQQQCGVSRCGAAQAVRGVHAARLAAGCCGVGQPARAPACATPRDRVTTRAHAPAACRCTACPRATGGACTPPRTWPSRSPGCGSAPRQHACLRRAACKKRACRQAHFQAGRSSTASRMNCAPSSTQQPPMMACQRGSVSLPRRAPPPPLRRRGTHREVALSAVRHARVAAVRSRGEVGHGA
jgi:hypothetical protein